MQVAVVLVSVRTHDHTRRPECWGLLRKGRLQLLLMKWM